MGTVNDLIIELEILRPLLSDLNRVNNMHVVSLD